LGAHGHQGDDVPALQGRNVLIAVLLPVLVCFLTESIDDVTMTSCVLAFIDRNATEL
jgi:hypothetical protein